MPFRLPAWSTYPPAMDKHTTGIERAARMKQWSGKKGGMPPATDPLADPAPGSPADLMARWLRHNQLRGCSPATVASYRWPLLRLLEWCARQPPGHPAAGGR